jgi:uncharacterized spore protein YtfJ
MSGEELLKTTVDELEKLVSTKNIIGDAIPMGERIVIPVASYGFAFGGGYAKGNDTMKGEGGGSGAGAGITPIAVIIIDSTVKGRDGIQVHMLNKKTEISELISTISTSLVPQIIEAVKSKMDKKENKESAEITENEPETGSA